MTLCMAWKGEGTVHFATDSRLMFGETHADVGVKVLSIPYQIHEESGESNQHIALRGEIGMCFAGSTISSLLIKESVLEILKHLQYAPGYTDISMEGIANFIFKAYRQISMQVCATALIDRSRADIIIAGKCADKNIIRIFYFRPTIRTNIQ